MTQLSLPTQLLKYAEILQDHSSPVLGPPSSCAGQWVEGPPDYLPTFVLQAEFVQ